MRTPKEIGDELEERAQQALGGEPVKQSGGGKFFKLDVRSKAGLFRFVWSCKNTDKPYLRITKDMLREAKEAARGMRGSGDGYLPGMVIAIEDGEAYALVPLDGFAELLTAEPEAVTTIAPSKGAQRRAGARRLKLG